MPDAYEKRDAHARSLWIFAGCFVASLGIVILAVGAMLRFLAAHPPSSVQASWTTVPTLQPPAPTLQVDPRREMERYRDTQQKRLFTYGWLDRQRGVIRIPIERAMALVAERGLPPTARWPNGATRLELQQQKATEP